MTASLTPSPDYDVLEGLARAATPGPWIRSGCRRKLGEEDCIMVGPDGFLIFALPIGARPQEHAGAFKDAGYLAAVDPQTILALIAKARAGEAAVEALPDLTAVIAWLQNGCDPVHAITELAIHQGRIDRARAVITKDQPQ